MKHFLFLSIVLFSSRVYAHCEVPCGIYADQRRFEEMLEDQQTIAKAITNINELSSKTDPLSKNQLVRWVVTKESHATNVQHIIAQYFLTQRIKPTSHDYADKLKTAHAVMVAAMKCKQTVDAESATALEKAIKDFHEAYEHEH
ncbi:Nickel-containing superoxide dismutase [Thalassoglobus neptunius]|uniref:Nickel-containing superoxide dismutase n=1 Tax=Thalassoglobus neptunius TaxID=1938619 RepID=A0A5C5V9U5_9PLAN|nr:superoxide dismutase [Ni] [Thalassoglobus neptunius]TWT35061.1 Nickel-containing superoxide dismutase [Thalassoglobus neptunius]